MQKNAFNLSWIISLGFITGCAPKIPPEFRINHSPPETNQPYKKKNQASSISSWQIAGAIAAKNKNKGWTASLHWLQQGPNRYQIRLFGPLGGGTVIIEKQGSTITYLDGPKRLSSNNADEMLEQQTGIRLPVNNLYFWVRGMPAPGAIQLSQYDGSHLITLKQAGYNINYTNYTSINNVDLPGKIELQGHEASFKLIIKHWTV